MGANTANMAIAKTIKQYLDSKHIIYSIVDVPHFESPLEAATQANIPPRCLYYPVVMRDNYGLMMAVMPASRRLDYERLSKMLHRNIGPAYQTQLSAVFADCQPGNIPPVGVAYGLRTVIDAALATPEEVYIVAGDHSRLIKMSRKSFMSLQTNALLATDFTVPLEGAEPGEETEFAELAFGQDLGAKLRRRVEQATELPPMPEMATRIFALRADPNTEVRDLAAVIEQDPSLAAQVMRYANSPYFGYQGRIDTLYNAIARVLGMDMVMNLALGLALAKPFKIPRQGPLGLDRYWRHAVYGASLMQLLSKEIPPALRPRPGTSYLVGLLHDFGYLILGHLFRKEFEELSRRVAEQGPEHLARIERDYLGVTHGELGYWLLKAWGLPQELVLSAREHHNEAYQGPHVVYVQLAQLSDHLLDAYEAGELTDDRLPGELLQALGLEPQQVIRVMTRVLESDAELNEMVRRMAA